jgi:uncharacterized membrane protein YfcA
MNHTAKIAVFGIGGFSWADWWPVIVVGGIGVIAGTRAGVRYLSRISAESAKRVFQAVVTIGAIRLILSVL